MPAKSKSAVKEIQEQFGEIAVVDVQKWYKARRSSFSGR